MGQLRSLKVAEIGAVLLFIVSGACWVVFKEQRPSIGKVVLTALTAFVILGMTSLVMDREHSSKTTPVVETDRAEMMLRAVTSLESFDDWGKRLGINDSSKRHSAPQVSPGRQKSQSMSESAMSETLRVVDKAVNVDPYNATMVAKQAILDHELNKRDQLALAIRRLKYAAPDGAQLAIDFASIYGLNKDLEQPAGSNHHKADREKGKDKAQSQRESKTAGGRESGRTGAGEFETGRGRESGRTGAGEFETGRGRESERGIGGESKRGTAGESRRTAGGESEPPRGLESGRTAGSESEIGAGGESTNNEPENRAPSQAKIENDLREHVPEGWFRERVLLAAYKHFKDDRRYAALHEKVTDQNIRLIGRLAFVVIFLGLSVCSGCLIILAQLFFMPRKLTPEAEKATLVAPAEYGGLTVFAVFMAWLGTQLAIQSLLREAPKGFHLVDHGVLFVAIGTALLYFISNAPGMLWAYLFAMRPHGVKFFEGFRLRLHQGKLGPVRYVLIGICTWLAALPIVIAAFAVSSHFLGPEGSTNPIIALISEAARSSNVLATLVFYLTVAVLAPICEETLFRGFLYTYLRRHWSVLPSMLFTAALFAGAHMDAGGFVPLFVLGAVFAFVLERTKSIVPCMIAHGMWNAGTFSLVLLLFGN